MGKAGAARAYDPLDGIDWGSSLASRTVNVFFAPSGTTLAGGFTSEGFNPYEIGQFRAAFGLFEAVSGLRFVEVGRKADADFVLGLDNDREMPGSTLGFMNPPDLRFAGHGVFNGRAWDREAGGDLDIGGYSFATIVHELLHGLGLAHPHDRGGTSSKFPGVDRAFDDYGPELLNQGIFTAMSYNSGFNKGPVGTPAFANGVMDFGYEVGPMALDIALLQQKYGVNGTHNAGNTVYELPGANRGGTHYAAIWDTGGTDEIRFLGGKDAVIDLRVATLAYEKGGGGFLSGVAGIAGGFTIAHGVLIENATSGSGDDTLRGNASGNRLASGSGDDFVQGLGGTDRLFGRDGNDRLLGGNSDDRLTGGNGDDALSGSTGNDVLRGSGGRDVLQGGTGDDTLNGGGGGDALKGGIGADTFVFGDATGRDTVRDFVIGVDFLSFDPALWGGGARSAAAIARDARVTAEGIVWVFDDGDRVLLEDLSDTTGLAGSILV